MTLPFTREQFFEVFVAYHQALWPAPLVLNALGILILGVLLAAPKAAGRAVSVGLALLWAWSGLAYHLVFFRVVNPAAPFFAVLALLGSVLFLWSGAVRSGLAFDATMHARKVQGLCVAIFALAVYPALGPLFGHDYPAAPSFGLPCPTTIFTFGVLMMARAPVPRSVVVVPWAWSLIGTSAAFTLGVIEDLSLAVTVLVGLRMVLVRGGAGSGAFGRDARP